MTNTFSHDTPHAPLKESVSPFSHLSLILQSALASCMEKKQFLLGCIIGLILVITLAIFWTSNAQKNNWKDLLQAQEVVSCLRHPMQTPTQTKVFSYQEIVKTLTATKMIRKQYPGELLQEAIIAKQPTKVLSNYLEQAKLAPLSQFPWKDVSQITLLLENDNLQTPLASIQSLLDQIEEKNQVPLYRELVGYLRYVELSCLQKLKLPTAHSAVKKDAWAKQYPDLAEQLNSLFL